jgi:hypothetical protein
MPFSKPRVSLLRSFNVSMDSGFYKHLVPPGPKSRATDG